MLDNTLVVIIYRYSASVDSDLAGGGRAFKAKQVRHKRVFLFFTVRNGSGLTNPLNAVAKN